MLSMWHTHTDITACVTIGLTYGGYSNYGIVIQRLHTSSLTLLTPTTPTNTYGAHLSDYVSLPHLLEFSWDKYSSFAISWCEFSHRVWIPFFIFYPLALSLRNFSGSHCTVLMYMYTNLLRNTKSRSDWKTIAGVISQWFWCNYFSHNFILYSEGSKKKDSTPILY